VLFDRDTIDLRIAKGLRKPCYSTHTNTSSNSAEYAAFVSSSKSHGLSDLEGDQHSCPIVQIEAVCGPAGSADSSSLASSGVSQFVSLETSGKAIVWAATHTSSVPLKGENVDFGLSPWGKIKLVRQCRDSCPLQVPPIPGLGGSLRWLTRPVLPGLPRPAAELV
jgi:hypothetical protein